MFTPQITSVAVAAANEGIPVAAIARIIREPMGDVYEVLNEQKAIGSIAELPKADWPPGTRVSDRRPTIALPTDDDLQFLCKKTFKISTLEAGFLVVLLKHRQVDKARLHNIVEQQRMTRSAQPSAMEATDPKMVDVIICKLRKKLKVIDPGIKIETIWGGGYFIEPAMKPRIIAHVNGEPDAPPQEAAALTNGNPVAAVQA